MIGFNLLKDDWIPVGSNTGTPRNIGVQKLLTQANQYLFIQGSTPLETAAIYRLLIAVIHSVYAFQNPERGISEIETWSNAWNEKQFNENYVSAYCSKYEMYFNLFDTKKPFFQDVTLRGKPESISSLMTHVASGADATLFSHNTQTRPIQLTLDQAARAVITIQAFGLAGTKGSAVSFNDAPCARGVMFFIEGNTLFETLMLNLMEYDLRSYRLKQREGDSPSWEQSDPFIDDPRRPYGLLDHLTWHNRRIRLVEPENGGDLVRDMLYAPGMKTYDPKTKSVREVFNPFHHWRAKTDNIKRKETDRSHSPISFRADKALWRDSCVLLELPSDDEQRDKPPATLAWVRELANQNLIPLEYSYRLLAIGACTQPGQDKTFFYRAESMPLPIKYFDQTQVNLIKKLGAEIALAEKVGKLLNRCAYLIAWLVYNPATPEEKFAEPDKTFDEQTLIDNKLRAGQNEKGKDHEAQQAYQLFSSFGVERLYWSQLEAPFYRFLQNLPDQGETALNEWRKHIRRTARAAFTQAQQYAGNDRRSLRASVQAEAQFERGLAWLLNVPQPQTNPGGDTHDTN
jgi:CRISPR system Cascade subunit CasA